MITMTISTSTATKTCSIFEAAKGEIDDFIIASGVKQGKFIGKGKTEEWLNLPCGFDIETTSFIDDNGDKAATMYEWTFGLDSTIIIGRTWEQYATLLNRLHEVLNLDAKRRIVIYVHNLAYEFQFMRFIHEWKKVFATDERKVLYAKAETGFIYRCSYLLSGKSLDALAESVGTVHKLKGALDYSLLRHSETPLTVQELRYCVYDVIIVLDYIRQCIEQENGYITRIPLTKTGYIRRYCKNQCYFNGGKHKNNRQYKEYSALMDKLQITGEDEYRQLKRAFQGGFTHCNAWYSGKTLTNVNSQDFNSSYPAVMVTSCRFPMSTAEKVEIKSVEDLKYNLQYFCCLFDAKITGVEAREDAPDHILSSSKCFRLTGATIDNGRVIDADSLFTTFTDIDFKCFCQFYRYKSIQVFNFRRYKRGYLPKPLVLAILTLYKDKTMLKGIDGKEDDYRRAKELLNSCYGMMVTDFAKPEQEYDNETGEWTTKEMDVEKAISKYNKSKNRFLFYAWGIFCTAAARQRLFAGLREFGEDYVYSDTDSIKGRHVERHMKFLNRYNAYIEKSIERAAKYHKIPVEMFMPLTANGEKKIIGVWENECNYDVFRAIGSKRYLTMKDGNVVLTVSGLNKQLAAEYVCNTWGKYAAFQHFGEGLYIPPEWTGKNTHTYIDMPKAGILKDYTGRKGHYAEYSSIHLSGADYTLSLADEYARYLLNFKEVIL